MRAMVVALALNIATNAEAACGDFCITYWWRTATVSDVLAKLDAGSNSTERDEWGRTPLHSAAMGGSPRTMQVLLDAGVNESKSPRPKTIEMSNGMQSMA